MANTLEIIQNRIKSKINQNILIHDTTHLSIQIKTSGFLFWKKHVIHVSGRVDYDREKQEIDKIIESESQGLDIINNLRVELR